MRPIVILLLLAVSTSTFAQQTKTKQPPANTVLFTVDKSPVYTDEFIYLYKKNHTKAEDLTPAKQEEYLNLLIIFKLKIAEARKRGMDTTAAFLKEYNTYKEELKKPYLAGADDLDRLAHEAYEHSTEDINARHILIIVKADASPADTLAAYNKITLLRQRALAGEDFEKLAKDFSEEPNAKINGGNLGNFTVLQMVYPFEKAAYQTPKGGISTITRTRFGYHIIKVYDRVPARGEVEISHILLRTGKGNDAKVKNTIFEIYDQLKAGRPWDELVKEYSEDPNTKNSGGKLKTFGVGVYAALPEFEQTAFALKAPGDISDPFQTSVGWHIIRLDKKIPIQPYKDIEAGLKRRITRDERLQISKTHTLQKRKITYGFTEDETSKKFILSVADSTLSAGKWKYKGTSPLETATLFTLGGDKTTVHDWIIYAQKHQTGSALKSAAYAQQLYDKLVEQKINEKEEQKLTSENPEFRMLLTEYKEGILLFEIMEKEVWNRASADTAGQHKFYRDHLTKYTAGNRLEARIFATPDKAFMETIKTKISKGDTISAADLKRFKSVQPAKAYERGDSKVIDKTNWVPGVQEIENDGVYYLVDVIKLVAPGVKRFDETRATVISDYQDALEKSWVVQLRQKYKIKVNKSAKKSVMESLKQ